MAHAIGLEVHRSHSTGFFRNLLEQENARLKRLVADVSLDNSILKEVAAGNF